MKANWLSYENGLLLLLGLTFGVAFFDRNAINYLVPFIIRDLDINNTQIGLLGSGLALSWALSGYAISTWSDRSGRRKPFLLASVILFSACSFLSGFAGSFLVLIAARVVMGVAEGPILPVSLAIMNVESTPSRRGLNAGVMQTFFSALLGSTLAPLILVPLAELFGWRTSFFIAGIPGLVCALLLWRFVREPDPAAGSGIGAGVQTPPAAGILQLLRRRNILLCALISCCMVAWYLLGVIFLPVFFTEYRQFPPLLMSRLMAVTGVCTVICGFLLPALSDRIGRKPVMVLFCLVGLLTPLAALYYTGPLWALAVLIFLGWSGTGVFPLFMGVIPAETVSYRLAATAMGLVVCIGEIIGGVFAPAIAGRAADATSLAAPVLIAAACALAGAVLSLFLEETAPAKTRR